MTQRDSGATFDHREDIAAVLVDSALATGGVADLPYGVEFRRQ